MRTAISPRFAMSTLSTAASVGGMIHRVLRRRIGPAYVALAAAAFVSLFIAVRSATHTGGVAAFVIAGDRYVDPQVRAELPVRHNSPGYDGQFVYRLARDPFTHQVTASGITLD